MRAIDTYEWLPGEFFLPYRVDAVMASTVVHSIEILGHVNLQAVEEHIDPPDTDEGIKPSVGCGCSCLGGDARHRTERAQREVLMRYLNPFVQEDLLQ